MIMNQRELDVKTIAHEFAVWEVKTANNTSLNLYDGNIFSEHTICEVLNCIYGYQLKNINTDKSNHPAIDLVDKENKIAFQITYTKTKQKIQETINKFIAHNLDEAYDQLIVFILGKKQKTYPEFEQASKISFDKSKNILDFSDLLGLAKSLPLAKIAMLKNIVVQGNNVAKLHKGKNVGNTQKKVIALKNKMVKDFLRKIEPSHYEHASYEPSIRFRYEQAIVRETGDRTFPGGDPLHPKWVKIEIWNFYDYGIEFIRPGNGSVIVDKQGFWDILRPDDPREKNAGYKVLPFDLFYRLSFENIAAIDLEQDGYYGYPTIYCAFNRDGWPWEEVIYGVSGVFKIRRSTFYFDYAKRKDLP
jgi:hypothetical protein